jgi:hypothetical protein
MPRYYFSLDDGKFLDDVDGTHLSNPVKAVLHAKQLARNLAKRPDGDRNWLWLRGVVVVDEHGHVVCTVPLRSVSAE